VLSREIRVTARDFYPWWQRFPLEMTTCITSASYALGVGIGFQEGTLVGPAYDVIVPGVIVPEVAANLTSKKQINLSVEPGAKFTWYLNELDSVDACESPSAGVITQEGIK